VLLSLARRLIGRATRKKHSAAAYLWQGVSFPQKDLGEHIARLARGEEAPTIGLLGGKRGLLPY